MHEKSFQLSKLMEYTALKFRVATDIFILEWFSKEIGMHGLFQAHRIVAQIVLTGGRVFGRAFAEAYKQASAASKYASQAQKGDGTTTKNFASSGLTLDEACKILNVKPPMGGEANLEHTMERFKKLFDLNDPKKGGSFYLQSKILRARERIEMEVRDAERKAAMEKELKEGWKPKVYKDR
ncbi:mitochondrial import inner membrane translocase subunit tim16 [Emergomyces pasteurianus Ep9510]|uniref:Mitochondrial import inner membrane translocase subunit TIM16 n=1 Tax=Emergomyces pasteurianus Ep9510 TaxID=1447872 RepID=A0A1J9P6M1_9EURO|nr:mitochondrial import inner membrane translocase subunit tim16 [Emergomyces pasteurianus Ep9510]